MRSRGKKGFALVFLLLAINFLSLFFVYLWHEMGYFYDASREYRLFYENYLLTQTALSWCEKLAVDNFDSLLQTISKNGRSIHLNFDFLLKLLEKRENEIHLLVSISSLKLGGKDSLLLESFLRHGENDFFKQSIVVSKRGENECEKGNTENIFYASHYCFFPLF